jgi:hypothetical protein
MASTSDLLRSCVCDDSVCNSVREGAAYEIERLRAYIQSLDGKTICIRGEGDTFIDDGIIVASDILGISDQQTQDGK